MFVCDKTLTHTSVYFYNQSPLHEDITLFLNPLNPKLFTCSTLSIHTKILKFKTFLTSCGYFNALNELFFSRMALKFKINSNDL